MDPLWPTVSESASLQEAAHVRAESGQDYVVIVNLSHRPVGLVTRLDLERWESTGPSDGEHIRCASLIQRTPRSLSIEDTVEASVRYYTQHGVHPLLVFDADAPVGVLHPTQVFQWCAKHHPGLVEDLADQAAHDAHP